MAYHSPWFNNVAEATKVTKHPVRCTMVLLTVVRVALIFATPCPILFHLVPTFITKVYTMTLDGFSSRFGKD
jgi:hypothetical protein